MNKDRNKIISVSAAVIAMLPCIMAITGWLTHNNFLRSIVPGTVTMKFNVALGLVFASAVLLLRHFPGKGTMRHGISMVLSVSVFLIGLLTLGEYFFGINTGFDELFVKDDLHIITTYYPGRMSPLSAVNFILIGTGMFLLNKEKTATYQFFYLSAIAFISFLMLIGFNFIADIPTFINLSIYDAIGFMMLAVAVYFAQPMLQKKISFEKKLLTGFSAVIILIAVLSIFSSYYNSKRIGTFQWVQHTNDVLNETQQVLSLTKDIGNEGRSYIITGDSGYLQYFMVAKDNLSWHAKKLKELAKDNSAQQVRVDSLSVLLDQWVGFSLRCIRGRDEKSFEVAKQLLAARQGKPYMDGISKVILEIQQEDNYLLIQRQRENEKSTVSFNRAFFVLLASIFVLAVIILFAIRYNITIRKKAQEKIKASVHMFSTLFYKSPVLKAIIDVTSEKYIEVNDAFVDFFGEKKEKILEKTSIEINMLGRPGERDQVIKNIRENGFVRELEMQLDSKNGKASWVSVNIDMVNLNGKDCFLSTGTDITKRKIAEDNLLTLSQELESIVVERTQELNRSEKSYRYLFENNPMPMWIIDLSSFKFLDINKMAILQYGYSREEFRSMTALDIRPDEDKELFKQSDHSFETNSVNYNKGIWSHRKKDGTIIQVEIIAHEIIFEGIPARFILLNDVTEKKKAEEKLNRNEKRFRALVENNEGIIALLDENFHTMYHTPSSERITGWPSTERKLMGIQEQIHPDDALYLAGILKNALANPGKSYIATLRTKHKNGHYIWLEGVITNMIHEPAVGALVTNFRDITGKKNHEEQQALFLSIVNSTDDAIFSNTPDGKISSWNRGAEKTFGYSSTDILGKNNSILIPSYLQSEENEIMEKIIKGEDVDHYETRRIKKDGKIINVSLTISAIKDPLGNITGVSKISRDITEKKRIEESLRLAEANYREIFDKASDAIYVYEMETGKVIEVNQIASKITGYTREELLSNDPQEFITGHSDYTLQHAIDFLQKAAAGEPQLFEWLAKNKDGSINWLEVNLKKAMIGGKERILSFFREINDRKKAQFEIQKLHERLEQKVIDRTEQLQAANKELEAFSYSVSHDLRAPLRAINGFTKKLEENYSAIFDNEGRRLFGRVTANAKKMGLLIDDLLEFSRLGRKEIHKSRVQMTELAEATLLEINATINHGASVKIYKLHAANADSTMIKQVMLNLLSNAIKYSSKTEKPSVEIKSHIEEDEIIYSVSDNGVGFNNHFVHKLFGVFQRLHLQSDFEGTGVGLALVKRIIIKHGGRVWAAGELNKGATFCFSLPATNNN